MRPRNNSDLSWAKKYFPKSSKKIGDLRWSKNSKQIQLQKMAMQSVHFEQNDSANCMITIRCGPPRGTPTQLQSGGPSTQIHGRKRIRRCWPCDRSQTGQLLWHHQSPGRNGGRTKKSWLPGGTFRDGLEGALIHSRRPLRASSVREYKYITMEQKYNGDGDKNGNNHRNNNRNDKVNIQVKGDKLWKWNVNGFKIRIYI